MYCRHLCALKPAIPSVKRFGAEMDGFSRILSVEVLGFKVFVKKE